jgi:hypothetical protein
MIILSKFPYEVQDGEESFLPDRNQDRIEGLCVIGARELDHPVAVT